MPDVKPLDFKAGPMVWIDLEMTGLVPSKDKILEIAVLITDGNLEVVDEGVEYIVHAEKSVLDGMDEWCTNQHGKTGLTTACLESSNSTEFVAQSVLEYIKNWIPEPRTAVLAGSSVHVDKTFLAVEMPRIVDHLHYRIVDVSSVKELVRRWYPSDKQSPKSAEISHRALDDIQASIRELKWYREHIFVPPPSDSEKQ
ncbi:ribonuclease H-like protein [Coprinellus micaceus]|uniref:Ribonuclease H-like protein n=1 Tax=Coprinellus micaceus TaxID=71717 RepID=A0A4Y7TW88_COPMI|nr:ribonuclease H-like protein [Coprinellus micaceus]